jgi:predicted deacetylase
MTQRIILLRFDDICPTMNWEQWEKAKVLMDSVGVKALLGVIPNNCDPDLLIDEPRKDFWEYIKTLQSEGFTIAMHGYKHVFDIRAKGIVTPVKHSEFAGHPYEIQYEKIRKGKEELFLHGIETDIFFAPAHSYDDNTLKALVANGFKYLSDGKSPKPYNRNGIICLPEPTGGIPNMKKKGFYTAVLHAHEWAYEGKKTSWERFVEVCKKHSGEIVQFEQFQNWSVGNPFIQQSIENINVLMDNTIKPGIIRIIR